MLKGDHRDFPVVKISCFHLLVNKTRSQKKKKKKISCFHCRAIGLMLLEELTLHAMQCCQKIKINEI